jgi:hypothetical protein
MGQTDRTNISPPITSATSTTINGSQKISKAAASIVRGTRFRYGAIKLLGIRSSAQYLPTSSIWER